MTWKPWTSYDEVPQSILDYPYNDQQRVRARDPELLRQLNELFNPQPWSEQVAIEASKAECSLCPNKLTSEERKTRLCTRCQRLVAQHGQIKIPKTDWSIRCVESAS